MRVVVLPVQFRTVGEALASGSIDVAITVADELPAAIRRRALFEGGFVCLHDPRSAARAPAEEAHRAKLPRARARDRLGQRRSPRRGGGRARYPAHGAGLGALVPEHRRAGRRLGAAGNGAFDRGARDRGPALPPAHEGAPFRLRGLANGDAVAERARRRRGHSLRAGADREDSGRLRPSASRGLGPDDGHAIGPSSFSSDSFKVFVSISTVAPPRSPSDTALAGWAPSGSRRPRRAPRRWSSRR